MDSNEQIIIDNLENAPYWTKANPTESFLFKNSQNHIFPAFRLQSWKDYLDLLNWAPIKNQKDDIIFRGQSDGNWELESSLSRMNTHSSDKPKTNILKKEVIKLQLSNFRKLFNKDFQDVHLWAIGQHHGLWTPYLDWTYSPDIALYFALKYSDYADNKNYFSISMLNKTRISNEYLKSILIIDQGDR